jgi:hypothetical protein
MNDQQQTFEALSDASDVLYASLPAGWHVGMPTYDSARGARSVTASGTGIVGRDEPQMVTGTGDTEAVALRDLDSRLRDVPSPNRARIDELRHQLRMAYVDDAEAFSRDNFDRGLTAHELARIIRRYEGQ